MSHAGHCRGQDSEDVDRPAGPTPGQRRESSQRNRPRGNEPGGLPATRVEERVTDDEGPEEEGKQRQVKPARLSKSARFAGSGCLTKATITIAIAATTTMTKNMPRPPGKQSIQFHHSTVPGLAAEAKGPLQREEQPSAPRPRGAAAPPRLMPLCSEQPRWRRAGHSAACGRRCRRGTTAGVTQISAQGTHRQNRMHRRRCGADLRPVAGAGSARGQCQVYRRYLAGRWWSVAWPGWLGRCRGAPAACGPLASPGGHRARRRTVAGPRLRQAGAPVACRAQLRMAG